MNKEEFIWKLLDFVCRRPNKSYVWNGVLPDWLYIEDFKEIRDKVIVFVNTPSPQKLGGHMWCRTYTWDEEMKKMILEIENNKKSE